MTFLSSQLARCTEPRLAQALMHPWQTGLTRLVQVIFTCAPCSYLAGVSRGLDAAGVPHVAVTTTDPARVQAELDGATVAALDEFLWVGSLLETFHLVRHTYPGTDAQARPHLALRQQGSSALRIHLPASSTLLIWLQCVTCCTSRTLHRRWRPTWQHGRAWWEGALGL